MQGHDYFQQLCTLAVVGELSSTQMAELNAHLADCQECRTSQAEFYEVADEFLTVNDRSRLRASDDEDAQISQLRERVISSARNHSLRVSDEAILGTHSLLERSIDYMRRARWEFRQWMPRAAVALSFVGLITVAGVLTRKLTDTRNELDESKTHVARAETSLAELNTQLQQFAEAKSAAGGQLLRSEAELSAARQRADELTISLQADQETIQRFERQVASLKAENAAAVEHSAAQEKALADSQQQLNKVQARASSIEGELVEQQYQIKDLADELQTQKLSAERDREVMAAGHEIRDLMGARDLHMIDVRDVDLKGNWKQPYGRIFLTDNKQLIFYAFDLHRLGGRDKSFQVWGQKFDKQSSTISLGTFHLDDQKQSRWIMKVSNPQLLSSIDSVFVTVENSAGGKRPTGKPLMNAYLRNPINHP